jgi:dimethylpropiothetin dethiomethylase
MTTRLLDCPEYLYVVRDYDAVYRYGSAGGSRAVRSHLRKVREAISDVVEANPVVIAREPEGKPVVAHLERALDTGARGAMGSLSDSLRSVSSRFTWEYGYERVPRGLADKYAYCEIVGPHGPVQTDLVILGLVLFAPNTTYPQHAHRDIEESYVAVSGPWSENEAAVYAPGSLILNRADHEHRITTGRYEPCLLAYAWIGPPERLRAPTMTFSPRRRPPSSRDSLPG